MLINDLAVRLDRNGDAEMSCIAGLGGQVLLEKVAEASFADETDAGGVFLFGVG